MPDRFPSAQQTNLHQVFCLEPLSKVAANRLIGFVGCPGKHIHLTIIVGGPEHRVKIHRPIEKAPGNITHQRAHEGICRNRVLAARPGDMGKIFIAAELERPRLKRFIAGLVICRVDLEFIL
jgi:hypothetical protein